MGTFIKIEEEENSEMQENQQRVTLLHTFDGEHIFIFYQSENEETEEDNEEDIDSNNLHFVTIE